MIRNGTGEFIGTTKEAIADLKEDVKCLKEDVRGLNKKYWIVVILVLISLIEKAPSLMKMVLAN